MKGNYVVTYNSFIRQHILKQAHPNDKLIPHFHSIHLSVQEMLSSDRAP